MEWLQRHRTKLLGFGGAVITIAGLASFQTWRDRLGQLAWAIHDNPVPTGIIVFGALLLVAANWASLRSFIVGTKRWRTESAIDDEISRWLKERGWAVKNADLVPGADTSVIGFAIQATDEANRTITLGKDVGGSSIAFVARVAPVAPVDAIIDNMDDDAKAALMEDLALELARYGVSFKIDPKQFSGDGGVHLSLDLAFDDSLTPIQIMTVISRLIRAILLVQVVIGRHARGAQREGAVTNLIPLPQSGSDMADSLTESIS